MATLALGNVWVNTNEVLLWSPQKHVSQSSALDDSKRCSCMRDWASEWAREGESESAIGRKSLHSHIGYPQYTRARWAAARARAPAFPVTLNGELMMRTRALDTTRHSLGRFFCFHFYAQTVVDWRLKFLEDAVVWNWRFRDAVSPVRSSAGSGFPFVRKERTLLSDVRNHHQPSCALSFSDLTLFATVLADPSC